ncbi:3-hydroxyacyl-ACP dehydratase FabZ family protein [Mucisphaera calidilacus]|uniref:3-hydroxyacyl-[acyl-carrier-protein] dehydratase FabZ n=1 Tax=Mucisphaera calidilacus TaxID=2527982 RepID=A0A518BW44_9BACT|nr:polyketide synthase dehydratase domain-containing protein [Mucisphaera calidilacus]QDU71144.1 3-hydroxyacyl-[acyl-carrier-protein] dehydratase FabZ [Mucisphaera calidilacus]
MRFELIDRVLEQGPDGVVAIKNVTAAEEYLGDHFPGFPVLPGVMMVEAMVQAGRRLAGVLGMDERLVIAEVRNVRFAAMVRPGQTLRVTVKPRKQADGRLECEGRGEVEGEMAVSGRFTLSKPAPAGV